MSNRMWDALMEHAKTCVLSGKLYVYYSDDERNVGVAFNNIYELSGLIAGEQFISADSLSDSQKVSHSSFRLVLVFSGDTMVTLFFILRTKIISYSVNKIKIGVPTR